MIATVLKETTVHLDPALLEQLQAMKDNYTIVHCKYCSLFWSEERIRIWPTTYLVQDNGIRKKLLHVYNIALYPEWSLITGPICNFTLLFEGLDKGCLLFDLLEDIPESHEFFVPGIRRNKTDVYCLDLS